MSGPPDGDRDELATVTFDRDDGSVVVIVGSGAGGGTLACELTAKGIDVVVIEAGPRFAEADFENDEFAMHAKLTWHDKCAATGSSLVAENFPEAPVWTCKGVGGTTLHWAGTSVRFQDYELRTRTLYGEVAGANLADWPLRLDELAPYYDRAEDKMGVTGTHGMPWPQANNNYKVMAAGARRIGYTQVDTNHMAINIVPRDGRNGCDQIGFCREGCKSGAKWSTMNAELPKAEATGRCEIRSSCMALRIEHDRAGRASGVLYADRHGHHHLQKARVVCVAGNAIQSPRLLLNSETSLFPDGLANGSGMVGKHYMRHTFAFVYGEFEQPVNMHRGNPCAGLIRDECRHDPARGFAGGYYTSLFAYGLPYFASYFDYKLWGRAHTRWIEAYDHIACLVIMGEDLALATNRLTLHGSEKDHHGLPIPSLNLDDHPNELAIKNHGIKKSRALYEAIGARRTYEAPGAWPSAHHMGTCRMSADPAHGVVDSWGRAHEVANLFVSDGSQFASAMAGNPTLTIVALAVRQAGHIAEAMGGGEI